MKRSRRQILKLLAAGSAAALAAPAAVLAETVHKRRAPRPAPAPATHAATPPASPALRAEIAKQKRDLLTALKTLRDYKLPAGSPLAFTFRPLRGARRGGGS